MGRRDNQLQCLEAIKEIDALLVRKNIWYSLSYGSALGAYRNHGFIEWDGDVDIIVKRPDQKIITEILTKNLSPKFKLVSHLTDSVGGFDEVDIVGVSSDDMHIDIYPIIAGPHGRNEAYQFLLHCRRMHRLIGCKHIELDRLKKKWKVPFACLVKLIEYPIPDNLLRKYVDGLMDKYHFDFAELFFPFSNDGKMGEIMEADLLFNTRRIRFEDIELPVPYDTHEYLRRIYGEDFMTPIRY